MSNKKNILVVDDDVDIRDVIAYALTDEGYNIIQAGNGEEALDFLLSEEHKTLPIGCIVLDLMMPRMSGEEFIRTIRKNYLSLSKIPIVVITAQGSGIASETLQGTKKIHKPMELEELFSAVAEACPQ